MKKKRLSFANKYLHSTVKKWGTVLQYDVLGSKLVWEYLWKSNVKVFDWPGNCPYLNPIENLWSYIKNKVAEKQPFSARELVTAVKKVSVEEISTDYCASLVKFMPSRLAAVVREKGGQTKY